MSSVSTSTVSNTVIKDLQVVETVILLAGSILFQFLIHLIPSSGAPLGAVLLAMFFAPLIAVIFFNFVYNRINRFFFPVEKCIFSIAVRTTDVAIC